MSEQPTTLRDLVGIEHSKLGFFQELRHKIEELEKAHGESENSRREIAAILDGVTDVMMVLSEDLRIISVNHVFRDLFAGTGEPEGRYCYELFRHEGHPCPECPAFKSLSTNSVNRTTAIFKLGGRNMQFEMVASPLKSPGGEENRVLIFKRDVTMEKEYQAKYYQAEKMATIGVLAAGVAHEVNNPLAAVVGFAEAIQRKLPRIEHHAPPELAADLAEYTDTILKECKRCQDIVQTLLRFSRPRSASFAPVNINQVVDDTLRLLEHHLRKRGGLELETNLSQGLPFIYADAPQLKQVLLNLLTNALDAVDDVPNGGRITVSTYAAQDHGVFLEVRDNGRGIPPENQDKLFEPFFTTKPVGRGIGIGLSTCYSIVREHGGAIGVDSETGQGSSFVVHLPINMA